MTPERIAEIEADGMCTMEDETAELCRLARLGLRVEGAPFAFPEPYKPAKLGFARLVALVSAGWEGKRVALVVLEDSK